MNKLTARLILERFNSEDVIEVAEVKHFLKDQPYLDPDSIAEELARYGITTDPRHIYFIKPQQKGLLGKLERKFYFEVGEETTEYVFIVPNGDALFCKLVGHLLSKLFEPGAKRGNVKLKIPPIGIWRKCFRQNDCL